MTKIVVLISGNGTNLQTIIDQISAGEIDAEIAAVISNRADAYGLERARQTGIATEVLEHGDFETRETFDQSLAELIDGYQPDLVALAGFMRILSDAFVLHYHNRLLNIHPSLLPKYRGLNTHQRALEAGDKQHGASVHFVIPELDAGTVIIHGVVPVMTDDTVETLAHRVHRVEHIIYPKAIKWLAEGDLKFENDRLSLHGKALNEPVRVYLPAHLEL